MSPYPIGIKEPWRVGATGLVRSHVEVAAIAAAAAAASATEDHAKVGHGVKFHGIDYFKLAHSLLRT